MTRPVVRRGAAFSFELPAGRRIPPGGWAERSLCAAKIKREDEPMWLWDDQARPGAKPGREDETARHARVAHARTICAACPVRLNCLAEVDPATERGVRGGWDLRDWDERHRKDALARAIQLARATMQGGAA